MVLLKCPNCHTELELALTPSSEASPGTDSGPHPDLEERAHVTPSRPTRSTPNNYVEHLLRGKDYESDDSGINGYAPDEILSYKLNLNRHMRQHDFTLRGQAIRLSARDICETAMYPEYETPPTKPGYVIMLNAWGETEVIVPARSVVIKTLERKYPSVPWRSLGINSGDARRIVSKCEITNSDGNYTMTTDAGICQSFAELDLIEEYFPKYVALLSSLPPFAPDGT